MRRRLFVIKSTAEATLFIERLLGMGLSFEVIPKTTGVDVLTPFDLPIDAYPDASWMVRL